VLTNKDLTPGERDYLLSHTGALFMKHEQWRSELIRQIQQATPVLAEV
jgi:hypothetical protein